MANTLGPLPFTTKVVSTSKENGELPAETFSGKVTAKGGLDSPGNMTISGTLLAKGVAALKGGVGVVGDVGISEGTINFPASPEHAFMPTSLKGYVPFMRREPDSQGKLVDHDVPFPWTLSVVTGDQLPEEVSWTWNQPESGCGYATSSMTSDYAHGDVFDLHSNLDLVFNHDLCHITAEVTSAMDLRGLRIYAPDLAGAIADLCWQFAQCGTVCDAEGCGHDVCAEFCGTTTLNGTMPGFIQFDATKLFWKDKEIYVENGVLKIQQ